MDAAAQELRRLQRLDRRTRLRAARGGLVVGPMFAVLGILGLAISDQRLAVSYWLGTGCLVMWISYWLSRKADRNYGVGATPASTPLTAMSILAAAVAVPSLGEGAGWPALASCGSALAVAAGLLVMNFVLFRPANGPDPFRLALPVLVIVAGSLVGYALGQPLSQPAAVVTGLLVQTWAWRSSVTR